MKTVPLDCDTILTARDLGINFGDEMPRGVEVSNTLTDP